MQTAPESWLAAMLTEWLQRAPNDTQGSASIESLTHALNACGIEAVAEGKTLRIPETGTIRIKIIILVHYFTPMLI